MDFDGEAFISYAHLDNVELVEGRKGWVANLHRALEVRVGQLLGKEPHIWRDPKLAGNDLFAETLIEKLRHVAALVTVVSPRYLKSEWTLRELEEFWRAAEQHGGVQVGSRARVFKVLKTPVPLDRTPAHLRALIGYEFFRTDPETGKIRELDEVFGPEAQRDFWIKLDDLAHDIVDLIEALENTLEQPQPGEAHAAVEPELAVYLAETTSDLRERRDALKRDLQQQGCAVLPDRTLPHVADEAREVIRADLARSAMSIHLVGRHYSLVPEGGTASLIELQHELASERASGGSFFRLLWIPEGISIADERQVRVVERLRLDPRIASQADLLETIFENLRTATGERLQTIRSRMVAEAGPDIAAGPAVPAGPASAAPPRLYLVADPRDRDVIGTYVDALFDQGCEVIQPIVDGDEAELREYHEENLATCDGVLIIYGAGNELWLRRKLREIQKAPGYGRTKPLPAIAIGLIAPRTPEKERFRTHEALVVAQWDGCAAEPLRPFVARLKAGGSL